MGKISNGKRKTGDLLNPFTVCSSFKRKFAVCSLVNGYMETRHEHGDKDVETRTWRHGHGDIDMEKCPFTVCSPCKRKFAVGLLVNEKLTLNLLNILKGFVHLWISEKISD